MSRCETTQDSAAALADWTPIQTPDGLWCVWSERTQLPIKLGTKQAILLPDVSKALGSIDRAHDAFRAANADPDRWDRLLASLPPATARFLASKVGPPVARREVVELRQMPVSSVSNPYVVGDQPPAAGYGRDYKTPVISGSAFVRGGRRTRANTPKHDDRIRALHAEGLHTTDIAKRVGCKPQTVRDAYKRMCLHPHRKPTRSYTPREVYTHPADDAIRALHAERLHNSEIARRAGVSGRVAAARVKALGLIPHKPSWWGVKDAEHTPAPTPTLSKKKRPKRAAGGKQAASPAADGATGTRRRPYSRRWMDQCAAAQRASEVTGAQALAALASERTHRAAAIKLGVTAYRLKQLLRDQPSEHAVRRAELVRIAILAVKAAGASLREVYDLGCASRATLKAIYNGETT